MKGMSRSQLCHNYGKAKEERGGGGRRRYSRAHQYEGLAALKDSLKNLPEELAPTREKLIKEQPEDETLTDAWNKTSPERQFRVIVEMLYQISTGEDKSLQKQVVIPEDRRRGILSSLFTLSGSYG